MINQGRIITAVNSCLRQKRNIDFELNKKGVCAGLAGLYIKYALENKTTEFFNILERLSKLPKDYKLGCDPEISDFIIQIEKTFSPGQYSNYQIGQGDIDKVITIDNKPIKNEFNFGLITDAKKWEDILSAVTFNNRGYLILSQSHAISIFYKHDTYFIYDPNSNQKPKEFHSPKEVLQELTKCFRYPKDLYGLSIRVFTKMDAQPVNYPSAKQLRQIAFFNESDKKRILALGDTTYQSTEFAACARDIDTLVYLASNNCMDWNNLTVEYLRPEFNELLLKQPKTEKLKNTLLVSIDLHINIGNTAMVEHLINHYLQIFIANEEQSALKTALQKSFDILHKNNIAVMKKVQNNDYFLHLFDRFGLSNTDQTFTNYNHLKLLGLINSESPPETYERFLKTLSTQQLIAQIQMTAMFNQHYALKLLINQLIKRKINFKDLPSVFDKELLQKINAITLETLFQNGFTVNFDEPELINVCAQRLDKTIFELYIRAYYQQSQQQIGEHIDKNSYESLDLETKIGPVPLINALIILGKNTHIKKAWKNNIKSKIIQSALLEAILSENIDISLFLQQQLAKRQEIIDPDTLDYLYQTAIKEENYTILSVLVQLGFNILNNTKYIKTLFYISLDNNDFSIIENCIVQANHQIRKIVLENALNFNCQTIIKQFRETDPKLFDTLFQDWVKQTDPRTRDNHLAKLNAEADQLSAGTFRLTLVEAEQKEFIKYCFHHKLFKLANALASPITLTNLELKQLLGELIESKNELGVFHLLKNYPDLTQETNLIKALLENNFFKAINGLLNKNITLSDEIYLKIFEAAFIYDNQEVVKTLLAKKKITSTTQFTLPLSEQFKEAIKKGHISILELFINSDVDFGINFKELFICSCEQKQAAVANALLSRDLQLDEKEICDAVKQLFDEPSSASIFEAIYQNAHGRLYSMLLKAKIHHPKSELLRTIRNSIHDPKFQKTALYLSTPPLKKALLERSVENFIKFFNQTTLPVNPDKDTLALLSDPGMTPKILDIIEKKYSLDSLIQKALNQGEWAIIANILACCTKEELSLEIQKQIDCNHKKIIQAYIEAVETHYEKEDLRPHLFTLLQGLSEDPKALHQLAAPYFDLIQETLSSIELKMINNGVNLNGHIYRHALSNKKFYEGLDRIHKIFTACHSTIIESKIDLKDPIENPNIVMQFAQIKALMAEYDIVPDYLTEEHSELLNRLANNPRFKAVCEQELHIFSLMKQYNLGQKSLEISSTQVQLDFKDTVSTLDLALTQAKLPITFVIPEIQFHINSLKRIPKKEELGQPGELNKPNKEEKTIKPVSNEKLLQEDLLKTLKNKAVKGITSYFGHRNATLSYLSYYFDYERGKIRTKHYLNLIKSAKTKEEIYVLQYALFVNSNGKQLKKDVAQALGYTNENSAKSKLKEIIKQSSLSKYSAYLDSIIKSLNSKINSNNPRKTGELFSKEIRALRQLSQPLSPLGKFSMFQPEHAQLKQSLCQWIVSWFGFCENRKENRLSQ
ncbi:hypothetical protein EP47_05510 [Legionella norrlandica]|uniref:Ankyrin repeat-containing protein n=1 Tax=Legionella norrlandica TaxID=1498499 RepID=A0A0A2SR28_9GAMM|nr:hypothetical protein [Legionella norrlandica]KGP63575.1 hypothetical protein EP47_05510 [Legionella norrlandica]